ncbi:MAG: PorV/PorQ family protein [Elusimicrobia bacterium]|nr:PorV/PorQ family protein [Elusimicrobiota bacterium]
MKMGAGARPAALGDTQAALAEGALSALWNPAGLGLLSAPEVSLTHNKWTEGVTDQRFVGAVPFKGAGALALAYERLTVDDFLGFDAQGTPTGSVKSGDDVLTVAWGRNLAQGATGASGLTAGVAAKVISEKVAGVSASGFAADFGVMVRPWGAGAARNPWFRRSSLGAAVRNLGQGLKFDSQTAALPTEYVLGLGYSQPFSGDLLTTGADLHQVTGEKTSISFGAEYWLKGLLALRVGYRSTDNTGAGLRAGAGFRLGKVTLDYAWSGLGENLGAAHRLTLGFRFGEPTPAPGLAADVYQDFVERGKRHMGLKLYDRAILDFNEALKINPASAEVQQWLLECGRLMEGGEPR